jgi:hypothetical protein
MLRRAARGHGTAAALWGAGDGRRGTGGSDQAEKAAGPNWDSGADSGPRLNRE